MMRLLLLWLVVQIGPLEIATDAPDKQARTIAREAERIRVAFERGTELDTSAPLRIEVPRDRSSHRDLQREMAARYVDATWPSLPLWLRTGLIDVYGTAKIVPGSIESGRRIDEHVAVFRRAGPLPMRELLTATELPADAKRFRAHAWLLTHYLLFERGGVEEYVGRHARDGVDVAFERAFRMSYELFARELMAYAYRPELRSRRERVGAIGLNDIASVRPREEAPAPAGATNDTERRPSFTFDRTKRTQLARYDEAVQHVARGRLDEALAVLDDLLLELPRGDIRDSATRLRAEVAEQIRKNVGR